MSPFPRPDYRELSTYHFDRSPIDVDLSDNTNQWGAHPAAAAALMAAVDEGLARYPELYADALRDAVAERLGVPAACVTTGCGSDDVLDSAFRAAAGPGAAMSYAAPTFAMVAPLARMNGMAARAVAWERALASPETLLEGEPSLIYVCRPNNPTGHLAPSLWVERLLDLADTTGPLVVLDEAYVDFGADSFVRHAVERPRLLVTRTLSKAYGLAGLRVGYGVAAADVAREVEKSRGPYKVSRVATRAAAAAVRDREGWVARTVAECVSCRERLTRELRTRGLSPRESFTNFILFRAPGGDAGADSAALRARGVAVRPFAGAWDGGRDALRVTVAPWPLLERFLEALDARLTELGEAEEAL